MALKGMAFAQGGKGGYFAGLYSSNPTLTSRGILQFTIDVPFSWTTQQKMAAPLQAVPVINLDTFKANHEVMAFAILFTGPWANPAPIPFECTFYRPVHEQIFRFTDQLPTPQSKGWEWWEWYYWRVWVGKAPHEMDRPGTYEVHAILSGVYDETLTQQVSMAGIQKTVNVNVKNIGTVDHSFRIEALANGSPLSAGIQVPIAVGQTKAASFNWSASTGAHTVEGKVWDNGNLLDSKQRQVQV